MDRQATSRIQPTTVVWPDTIDEILAGDCVVMLAYVTHEQHDHRQQRRCGRRGAGLHGLVSRRVNSLAIPVIA